MSLQSSMPTGCIFPHFYYLLIIYTWVTVIDFILGCLLVLLACELCMSMQSVRMLYFIYFVVHLVHLVFLIYLWLWMGICLLIIIIIISIYYLLFAMFMILPMIFMMLLLLQISHIYFSCLIGIVVSSCCLMLYFLNPSTNPINSIGTHILTIDPISTLIIMMIIFPR